MHKYEIISSRHDKHFKYKPSDWYKVVDLMDIVIAKKELYEEVECFLSGEKATPEQLKQAALDDHEAYLAKKRETHKKIWVGTGATGLVKKPLWVRK